MIEETATVVALSGGQVWVQRKGQGLCAQCQARGGCGQGAMAKLGGERAFQLLLPNARLMEQGKPVAVGDTVVIGIAERALLGASALVYLLPLLLMLCGALMAQWLGADGDAGPLLAGGLGLSAGFALAALCQRRLHHSPRLQPQLLRLSTAASLSPPSPGCLVPEGPEGP
ncbi:MAG: SoxR reducing system RseC family protein [Oleiphilaceae bacterium]|nr:SoxR reducing system RseC family protein [Oleiphilaceae bacterium]